MHTSLIDNAVTWALANQYRTDYAFKCLAFVEDAFEQSNAIEMFGGSTATESAEMYGVTGDAPPPKGAFVFYDTHGPSPIDGVVKNWGHVGLCIGDGKVIHTWDRIRIDDHLDLEELGTLPGWSPLRYRGWTPPEVFLNGHRPRDWSSSIHQAQPCDVDAIHRIASENHAAILSRVHGEAAMRMAHEESTKDALLRQLGWKHVLVAKVANEVVGTAALANFGQDGIHRWCVSNVYVDMRFHRKGIGTDLVEAVIGLARARGAARIEVPSSRNAIDFYKRFGFVVSGPEAPDEVTWMVLEQTSHE